MSDVLERSRRSFEIVLFLPLHLTAGAMVASLFVGALSLLPSLVPNAPHGVATLNHQRLAPAVLMSEETAPMDRRVALARAMAVVAPLALNIESAQAATSSRAAAARAKGAKRVVAAKSRRGSQSRKQRIAAAKSKQRAPPRRRRGGNPIANLLTVALVGAAAVILTDD